MSCDRTDAQLKSLNVVIFILPCDVRRMAFLEYCCIKILPMLKEISNEDIENIKIDYDESTMVKLEVYEWHRSFKEGREYIEDDKCVGKPSLRLHTGSSCLITHNYSDTNW